MRLFMVVAAVVCFTTITHAQQVVTTTPFVRAIIPDEDVVHVFTGQIDVDFNGMQDEGDATAKWHIVNVGTLTVTATYDFPWGSVTSQRPAFDKARSLMYVGVNDTIWAYTSRTQVKSTTPLFVEPHNALAYNAGTADLLISQRPSFTDPGTVIRYNVSDESRETIPVDVNPQQTLAARLLNMTDVSVTVCEGVFGQANGSIVKVVNDQAVASIVVGDTPNHMAVDDDRDLAFVAVNGSHQLKIVDLVDEVVRDSVDLGTSGFNGPREVALGSNYAFVTSYDSKLHVVDRNSLMLVGEVELPAKADPVALVGSSIWVGLSYETGGFIPRGDVLVYPVNVVSVAEEMQRNEARKAMVITSNEAHLRELAGSNISIVDTRGAQQNFGIIDGANGTVDVSRLANGIYIAHNNTTSIVLSLHR